MVELIGPLSSGAAVGDDGLATSSQDSPLVIRGELLAVVLRYNDSPPATTDVSLATKGTSAPANTILTISNAASDGWFYPRHQVHGSTGAGLTYDGTRVVAEPVPICDYLTITISQANAGDSVDVWLLVR